MIQNFDRLESASDSDVTQARAMSVPSNDSNVEFKSEEATKKHLMNNISGCNEVSSALLSCTTSTGKSVR